MADIYLTKVERKTIFTQGFVYVILMMIIADLTVTGPYILCTIPLLYIMGILSINKFEHQILTVVIAIITVFVASCFMYKAVEIDVLINTLSAGMLTTCGIVTGQSIKRFVLRHRLVKYLTPFQIFFNICMIVFSCVIAILTTTYVNGNIVMYGKSKADLNKYLQGLYGSEYNVKNVTYVKGFEGIYEYEVEVLGYNVTYVYDRSENKFKDNNYTNRNTILNDKLNEKFNGYVSDVFSKLENEYEYTTEGVYSYDNQTVVPFGINVELRLIIKDVNVMDDLSEEDYKNMIQIMNDIFEFQDEQHVKVNKIVLSVCDIYAVINRENKEKVNLEYLRGNFTIEEKEGYTGTIE